MSDANAYLRVDPTLVRINSNARPLVEAITGQGLDPDTNLKAVIGLLLMDTTLDDQRRATLTIIQERLP